MDKQYRRSEQGLEEEEEESTHTDVAMDDKADAE